LLILTDDPEAEHTGHPNPRAPGLRTREDAAADGASVTAGARNAHGLVSSSHTVASGQNFEQTLEANSGADPAAVRTSGLA
jgi:hypothetical protein